MSTDPEKILEDVRSRVVRMHGDLLLSLGNQGYHRVAKAIREETRAVLGRVDEDVEDEVIAHLIGLGPVDKLRRDPDVSEIMINAPDEIYVERCGRIERTDLAYRSVEDVENVLHRIVQQCGRRVNFSSPLVDASLPDGSRVNAIVPPAAKCPVITIRRFVRKVFTTDDLVANNFLTPEMVMFLQILVRGKANIVVCGATGCGKTTFLRWLAGFLPPEERIIVIEDTRELNLDHPHCVSLEATDKAGIYELMINALRMRPDRIILGEVRGAEAFELLQAMGTGHEGSLTTVHANYGKQEAVHRLVRAMLRAGGITSEELEGMVAETVDFLVFVKRFPDGMRRVVHVTQVESDRGRPAFRDIYRYRRLNDRHERVGTVSSALVDRLAENLGEVPANIPAIGGGRP